MIISGEGRYQIWLEKKEIGDDLVYILGGGDKPHIGGMVLKVPDQEVQVVNIGIHKDFHILVPIAEHACERYNRVVVVTGGVHIDNASREEIDIILQNVEELMDQL